MDDAHCVVSFMADESDSRILDVMSCNEGNMQSIHHINEKNSMAVAKGIRTMLVRRESVGTMPK